MPSHSGEKLLIVDDEQETRRVLQLSLRGRGYSVEATEDPRRALALCAGSTPYDLLLTDYSMPGMNGMELLKAVRDLGRPLPVILMTAYGEKDLLVEALRNECDGFIEKPFAIEALVAEIERVRRAAGASAGQACPEMAELVPMLVHQINNPLTSIMGSAQLGLVQSDDSDPIKERLTQILEATNRIRQINAEILNLGKSLNSTFEAIDVVALARDCLDSFASFVKLYGVTVNVVCDRPALLVYGNRFGLEQMFCNLIANGLEAMRDKGGTFKVQLSVNFMQRTVEILIADSGSGMSEAVAEKVFTPYFTTKKGGTGLGLAVVKRVVGAHRGAIKVQSEIGHGTVFAISLPEYGAEQAVAV